MSTTPESAQQESHELRCLEVWGGSSGADHAASVPGLDISISSQPIGGQQGGDLYLISSCSSGWISRMLLADVSGHGQSVSDLSAKLRKAMHKSLNTVDQSKLARTLNEAFDQISGGKKFATALLMTYYAPTGHLIFVNAGHPPPLMSRAGNRPWEPIVSDMPGVITRTSGEVRIGITNLPLGVIASTDYEQFALKIEPGDRVCGYTDAYIESRGDTHRMLGVDGFCALLDGIDKLDRSGGVLSGQPPSLSEFAADVHERMDEMGYIRADDDHTLMVFSRNGHPPPRLSVPIVGNWIKNNMGLGHTDTVV